MTVITGGHESETLEESIARISRAIAEAKEEKKMYSIRLKVKTVESIKRKSAAFIIFKTGLIIRRVFP